MYHCLVMAIYSIKEKKKKQLPTTPMQCISLANQKVINLLPDCHIEAYECIVYWYSKYRSVIKVLASKLLSAESLSSALLVGLLEVTYFPYLSHCKYLLSVFPQSIKRRRIVLISL